MKKIIFIVSILMVVIVLVSCNDTEPIETEIPIGDLYELFYTRDDFDVYKLKELPNEHTNDLVELGVYKGDSYYLTSGTYLDYYVVIKDTVQKDLLEALEANWFELKELVENFNLPTTELGFEAYLDEELLAAVQDIRSSLEVHDVEEVSSSSVISLSSRSFTPIGNLETTRPPFEGDIEWVNTQATYYAMLEEIVRNGYFQGAYVDIEDYLQTDYGLLPIGSTENVLIMSLDGTELFSRILVYEDATRTKISSVDTVLANKDIDNPLDVLRIIQAYINGSLKHVDIFEYHDEKGLAGFSYGEEHSNGWTYSGLNISDNLSIIANLEFSEGFLTSESFKFRYYDENDELYLEVPSVYNTLDIATGRYNLEQYLLSQTNELSISTTLQILGLLLDNTVVSENENTLRFDEAKVEEYVAELEIIEEMHYDLMVWNGMQNIDDYPEFVAQRDALEAQLRSYDYNGSTFNFIDTTIIESSEDHFIYSYYQLDTIRSYYQTCKSFVSEETYTQDSLVAIFNAMQIIYNILGRYDSSIVQRTRGYSLTEDITSTNIVVYSTEIEGYEGVTLPDIEGDILLFSYTDFLQLFNYDYRMIAFENLETTFGPLFYSPEN